MNFIVSQMRLLIKNESVKLSTLNQKIEAIHLEC